MPSQAQTAVTEITPMSLLPEVFTRIDYLPTARASGQRPMQSPATVETDKSETEHIRQDLDLALENFFYALEDLMQSASRYEASVDTNSPSYVAQVQFPAQVMSSLASSRTSDQATNTTVGTMQGGETTSPAIRARGQSNPTRLSEFNFSGDSSINLAHNDNIYTTRTDEQADQILKANINGVAESRSRTSAVLLEGHINSGSYNHNAENNYTDWNATSSYSTLLGARSKGFVGLGYFYHHEDRGEGSTDGNRAFNISEPVEFESWVARGIYELGARQARTRFVADGNFDQLRTTNLREIPEIRARDRDIGTITGTAYYKWTQRLSYLAELRHMDIA